MRRVARRRTYEIDLAQRRALEAELTTARSAVARARVDYAMALDSHSTLSVVRRRYHRLSHAYRLAITAAMALEHDRPGSMHDALEQLRRHRQRHLLSAPAGVLAPVSVRPRSHAPYGPLIPGMDFDPDDPMVGSPTGREWGVELPSALDEVGTPTRALTAGDGAAARS
ncbi:hypothetical protein [Segeticoccus rhizosphaerae]|jgi:hypothetical protein|uniref:hypothetical protein n=1 Tax=Segeticoccus rhizosphaerae TaxID=1104777 RepID=UPI001264E05F|nr:hypothetical protein [Segeticoccus rhizosphaerae]